MRFVAGIIAMQAVSFAEIEQHRGERVDLAAEGIAHRKLFAGANQCGVIGRLARELAIKISQRLRTGRIDEEPPRQVEKVVTGGALDRPRLTQALRAKKIFSATIQVLGQAARRR